MFENLNYKTDNKNTELYSNIIKRYIDSIMNELLYDNCTKLDKTINTCHIRDSMRMLI